MIGWIIVIVCILLAVAVAFVVFKKFRNSKSYKRKFIGICLGIINCVLIICCIFLPNLISENVRFNSFESYLIWSEGRTVDGFLGIKACYETEDGYIFSYSNHAVSGFLSKDGNKYKELRLKPHKVQAIEFAGNGVFLFIYSIKELDTKIIVSINQVGKDFDFSVNGENAELYLSENEKIMKINYVKNADDYTVVFNGNEQTLII